MLFEEMKKQVSIISEADASMDVQWDFEDIAILQPAGSSGSGGGSPAGGCEVMPVGKPPKPKPGQQQQQQPGQPQPDDGTGDPQPGKTKGKGKKGPKTGDDSSKTPSGGGGTAGEGIEIPLTDSHDHFGQNAGTPGDEQQWMDQIIKEAGEHIGNDDIDSDEWGSDPGNTWKGAVKKIVRQRLPIQSICDQLLQFKMEISEKMSQEPSYALSSASGVSMGGANQVFHRPYDVDHESTEDKSALLFFAVDTSGSITDEDYEKVFGWLDTIADFFEKKENGGIPGRVYLLEWDTEVYTPIRRWRGQNSPDPSHQKVRMRGGGGTDFQNVFNFLNKQFVKTEEGNGYTSHKFNFSDTMKGSNGQPLIDYDPNDKIYDVGNDHVIREVPTSQDKEVIIGAPPKGHKFSYGDMILEPGATEVGNVPFLLVYTDGYFDTPTNFGPLYRENLGNILYIATKKLNIQYLRPRNFIYCDMYIEGFEKELEVKTLKKEIPDK